MLQESSPEAPPKGWCQTRDGYLCPRCCAMDVDVAGDVLEEEVIYPAVDVDVDDTLDDLYCEVCNGPCQGH